MAILGEKLAVNLSKTTDLLDNNSGQINEFVEEKADWTSKNLDSKVQALFGSGCAIGILGNLMVIIVIISSRKLNKPSYWLIGNLAVTDCLSSVLAAIYDGFGLDVQPQEPGFLSEFLCIMVTSEMIFWTCAQATVDTMVIISMERYYAIVYPTLYKQRFGRQAMKKWIALAWLLAPINTIWIGAATRYDPVNGGCRLYMPEPMIYSHMWGILMYHIPVPIVVILYTRAYFVLTKVSSAVQSSADKAKNRASQKLLRLMIVIFLAYLVCYTFQCNGYTLWSLGVWDAFFDNALQPIAVIIMLSNSWINPIVYSISSEVFRSAILDMFACCRRSSKTETVSTTASKVVTESTAH